MNTILQDLRYALRQWRKSPGFTLTVIAVLTLGLGANIAVFTVLNGVILRPLPYAQANRLMVVRLQSSLPYTSMRYANAKMLQDAVDPRHQPAAVLNQSHASIVGPGGRYQVAQQVMTTGLLRTLGVQPALGRLFREDENRPGNEQVMLLGYDVWQKLYHGDRNVIGKSLLLRGKTYSILGVMPKAFSFPYGDDMQVWSPAPLTSALQTSMADEQTQLDEFYLSVPDGMNAEQLQSKLNQVQAIIAQQNPSAEIPAHLTVTSYQESMNHEARKPLWLLYCVVVGIWMLACLNVTSLMLTRAVARSREMAMRSALGASRWRLLQQSILESLFLSLTGAGIGLLLSESAFHLLQHTLKHRLPMLNAVHTEWRVLLFLLALTLLTALVVGVFPALRAMRRSVQKDLQGGAATASSAQHRTREALVVAQLALTLTFLVGAGLFLRTIHALRSIPLGFTQQNVLSGGIILNGSANEQEGRKDSANQNIVLTSYMPLLDKLNAIPGVKSAALSSVLPLRQEFNVGISSSIDGHERSNGKRPSAEGRLATAGLTDALGIPMIRGRFFSDQDRIGTPAVAVVNQAFVNSYLPGTDPVGHSLSMGKGRFHEARIIGVIRDVKQKNLTASTKPEVYFCLAQVEPDSWLYGIATAFIQVAIRSTVPADLLRTQFDRALHEVAPFATTTDVMTIHEAAENSFGSQKLIAYLLEGFAGVALLIASIGLYGLLSFSVAQRTREIGVRLALGASQQRIRAMVLRRAMLLVAAGLVIGSVLAWFACKLSASYLYGVQPHDALTFSLVILTLAASAIAASWLPARRAAAVDPMQALRSE